MRSGSVSNGDSQDVQDHLLDQVKEEGSLRKRIVVAVVQVLNDPDSDLVLKLLIVLVLLTFFGQRFIEASIPADCCAGHDRYAPRCPACTLPCLCSGRCRIILLSGQLFQVSAPPDMLSPPQTFRFSKSRPGRPSRAAFFREAQHSFPVFWVVINRAARVLIIHTQRTAVALFAKATTFHNRNPGVISQILPLLTATQVQR